MEVLQFYIKPPTYVYIVSGHQPSYQSMFGPNDILFVVLMWDLYIISDIEINKHFIFVKY